MCLRGWPACQGMASSVNSASPRSPTTGRNDRAANDWEGNSRGWPATAPPGPRRARTASPWPEAWRGRLSTRRYAFSLARSGSSCTHGSGGIRQSWTDPGIRCQVLQGLIRSAAAQRRVCRRLRGRVESAGEDLPPRQAPLTPSRPPRPSRPCSACLDCRRPRATRDRVPCWRTRSSNRATPARVVFAFR